MIIKCPIHGLAYDPKLGDCLDCVKEGSKQSIRLTTGKLPRELTLGDLRSRLDDLIAEFGYAALVLTAPAELDEARKAVVEARVVGSETVAAAIRFLASQLEISQREELRLRQQLIEIQKQLTPDFSP